MPLVNPVPVFNFNVFLLDAKPFPSSASEALTALGSLAVSVGKSVLFGSFSEVTGLSADMELEEYREGGWNRGPHRFMKWGKYPNIVLKRGVTFNTDIWDWYYQVLYGSNAPIRKNGVIVLNDRGGLVPGGTGSPIPLPLLDRTPVSVWFFSNGLPEKLQGPGLNAKSNELSIETLEIAHEWLVRVGPGMIPGVGETLSQFGV
jgi:phage tail-like protein